MGYSADGRSRKAVMKRRRKKQALPADFNQMVAQQQMADYGLASGQFGQQYPLYNSQEAYPQQGQPQQPQLPQQGMSGYQQPVNGYDAYGQPVTAEPQYQQPPALPPVYNGEPVTAPLEQQQPVYDAEVVGIPGYPVGSEPVAGEPIAEGPVADNRQKFCGNCGTESRPNWFICPNCKEML